MEQAMTGASERRSNQNAFVVNVLIFRHYMGLFMYLEEIKVRIFVLLFS